MIINIGTTNKRFLLVIGIVVSCVSLVYVVEEYWHLARYKMFIDNGEYSINISLLADEKRELMHLPEANKLISDIKYKDKIISMLLEGDNITLRRVMIFLKVEIASWFCVVVIFIILFAKQKRIH